MKKWIIPSIIVLLSLVIIYQLITLKNIKDSINDLNVSNTGQYNLISQDISSIESRVESTINQELAKTHLTKDVAFTFDKSIENGNTINVRVELSKINEDSKVIFMYKEESKNNWNEIELKEVSKLSYMGKIDLSSDKSYKYKVVTTGTLSESGDVEYIDKYQYTPNTPTITGYGGSEKDLHISLDASIYEADTAVNTRRDDIKSIEAIVGFDGKEKIYKYKEKEETFTEPDNIVYTNYVYEVNIPRNDYNKRLDYIKNKITYKNGMIDVIDITEQIKEAI